MSQLNLPSVPRAEAGKQDRIVSALAKRIFNGEWQPGFQLPTVLDLQKEYGVALNTVQRSLKRLKAAGLTEASRGRGTFVAEDPVPLTRNLLLFGPDPKGGANPWSLFYDAMIRGSKSPKLGQIEAVTGWEGLNGEAILGDVHGKLAEMHYGGVIFGSHPMALKDDVLGNHPLAPAVAVASAAIETKSGRLIPSVYPDLRATLIRSLDFLKDRGRRRPALLVNSSYTHAMQDEFSELVKARGFDWEPWWVQVVPMNQGQAAANSTLAILNPHQVRRPDCLVVMDDHLVPHAFAGLRSAGVRVPEDLEVVAYCNYPLRAAEMPGVHWLGVDAREVLAVCVEKIQRQRAGLPVEPCTKVQPVIDLQD